MKKIVLILLFTGMLLFVACGQKSTNIGSDHDEKNNLDSKLELAN